MECPRCGGTLETYSLWGRETKACGQCNYIGVPVEHKSDREAPESWDDAISRFYERYGEDAEVPLEVDELDATELPDELVAESGDDAGSGAEPTDEESVEADEASGSPDEESPDEEPEVDDGESIEEDGESVEDDGEPEADDVESDTDDGEPTRADGNAEPAEGDGVPESPGDDETDDAEVDAADRDSEVAAETDGGPAADSGSPGEEKGRE